MELANGRIENLEETESIEKLFGIDKTNPYGTNDPKIFSQRVAALTHSQLQEMAQKLGLNPYVGRQKLIEGLEKSFAMENRHRSYGYEEAPKLPNLTLDSNNPKDRELMIQLGMRF